ncbi:hypothetical protein BUALT_Bualt18G0074300 [Buddleja alternifolia]|uniref:Transmembrane protein n=1 Tax=Buddleja alternifolia TaxID=168488 RepID=A0AAV6WBR8_9LAMI|nr:hypothetical protein BUALT_Bualt18G0074300 [Buddleja alternifolia]
MEITEKLRKFEFHILLAVTFSSVIFLHCYLAPSYFDILNYFRPLLFSTSLFLVAVVVLRLISPPSIEAHGEEAGEGLLEYVVGQPTTGNVQSLAAEQVDEEEESVEAE